MRRSLVLAVVTALALTLSACGDDDGDEGAQTPTPPAETAPAETTPAEEAPAGAGATMEVSADPGGQLAYEQDEISVPAGEVEIDFTNAAQVPHDVVIEDEAGDELARTDVITDDEAQATADLEPGTYTFYCSVNGHRQAGMEGTLVVE